MRENPKTRETKIFHVFSKLNMKEAMDHLAQHGSFNMLDMAKEPSLAKIIRNYSGHSLAEHCNSNYSLPATNAEEMEKSETILDMAAVEAKYSKKMADDSKIHHILDDAMFVPRRRFSTSQKHVLPDLQNHPPFKHNLRKEIRQLASINKGRAKTTRSLPKADADLLGNPENLTPHKNVSFSQSAPINKAKRQQRSSDADSLTEDEDMGITFTARHESDQSEVQNDIPDGMNNLSPGDKTAIEKVLPWRRTTSRDECPDLSVAPSWANNLSYHGLTESDSPYTSPQTTIQREGDTTQPSVFNIFPRVKSDDTDSAVGVSDECLNVCPLSNGGEIPHNFNGNDVGARSRARGHRDSGVIDSDENGETIPDIPSIHFNAGSQQNRTSVTSSGTVNTEDTQL